ncbi:MAG: rhodanese-like domain-containing protein [Halioglobus sp.]|nr:rhodanese-like domain-containing protein [Halioglobus sp.]
MDVKALVRMALTAGALCVTMVAHAEPVWIDVRSWLEHRFDNIDGDIRIPHDEIVEQVRQRYPDRATEMRLYCRSGGRSDKAVAALQEAGYTNVSNAGSIDDARRERGLLAQPYATP